MSALLLMIWGCNSEKTNGEADIETETDGMDFLETDAGIEGDGHDACLPEELCNGIDDDCDGEIDEGFDLMADTANCGACNFPCVTPNAVPRCVDGTCGIAECLPGSFDINGDPYDGCEYSCTKEADAESSDNGTCSEGLDNDCDGRIDGDDPDCNDCIPELCNGEDDDCDSRVDEDFDLRTDILNCGACRIACARRPNSQPICVMGECDIRCHEGYSDLDHNTLNGCEAICVPTPDPSDSSCDGIDNDCDGVVDEDCCSDGNPCTTDTYSAGVCSSSPAPDMSGCPDGVCCSGICLAGANCCTPADCSGCIGSSSPCSVFLDEDTCNSQAGCSFEAEGPCAGAPTISCSSITNATHCQECGCTWFCYYTCVCYGTPMACSEHDSLTCASCGCPWDAAGPCEGTHQSCFTITDRSTCETQRGCHWSTCLGYSCT